MFYLYLFTPIFGFSSVCPQPFHHTNSKNDCWFCARLETEKMAKILKTWQKMKRGRHCTGGSQNRSKSRAENLKLELKT